MILIAASNKDMASLNIAKQILNCYSFKETGEKFQGNPIHYTDVNDKSVELVTLEEDSVYAQNLTDFFVGLELIVFISRHSSLTGTPTLSVHTPGNLGEAQFGGLSKKVSISPANAMRNFLRSVVRLKRKMQLDYEVSYECTHHGPSLDVPTMFVELGSTLKQWNDLKAAEAIAHATIEAISRFGNFPAKAVVGIGGPHYNNRFTRMALENEIAFGHIIPKYASQSLDSDILRQCVERTLERVELAVLDWKGIKSEYKPSIVEMIKEIGIPFKKV